MDQLYIELNFIFTHEYSSFTLLRIKIVFENPSPNKSNFDIFLNFRFNLILIFIVIQLTLNTVF